MGFELEYDELNLVTKSINKLGKLEDLEETLGMDLEKLQETVEKAKKYEEKETPCKPVRIYPPFGDNVPVKRYPKIFGCGICEEQVIKHYEYCPKCGNRIEWGMSR